MKSVKLIECIKTWQGEGVDNGKPMLLCRFKYCNRKCKYCDTLTKMRISQESNFDIEELQNQITKYNLGIMVTGGEGTIDRHFEDCLTLLNELNYPSANVETNGFQLEKLIQEVDPNKKIKFICSPKIFSESDLKEAKRLTKNLESFPNVYFKIVYEDNELIHNFLEFISNNQVIMSTQRVYLMPEGATRVDMLRNAPAVFDNCEKYKLCFSSRTHIMYGFV